MVFVGKEKLEWGFGDQELAIGERKAGQKVEQVGKTAQNQNLKPRTVGCFSGSW
jgi:hypothetical protein